MNTPNIKAAKQAAKEFIKRADIVLTEYQRDHVGESYGIGSIATGALRRQSMELTRALAKMRSSN